MAAKRDKPVAQAQPKAPPPPDMPVKNLAKAILARELRPRVSHIRQLAEAVLASRKGAKKAGKKKDKKRKLAKIPRANA